MTNDEYVPMHPAKQLLYLVLVFFGCLIIGTVLSCCVIIGLYGTDTMLQVMHMSVSSSPEFVNSFKIFMALGNTLIPFLGSAMFFGYFIVSNPGDYLKTNSQSNLIYLLLGVLVLAIMFGTSPLIEYLGNLNQQLQLPQSMSSVQQFIKQSEDGAEQVEAIVLNMNSTGDFISSLLIVGFLPALSEEFFFRGIMQTIFSQWTKNIHAAVWITAIVFSFFHFEFFGFLPRVLLGAVLGYFVAWTGNIWLSVWGHFINNGTAVVMLYLFQHKISSINPDSTHLYTTSIYIFSTIITLILLLAYKKIADAKLHVLYEGDDYD